MSGWMEDWMRDGRMEDWMRGWEGGGLDEGMGGWRIG